MQTIWSRSLRPQNTCRCIACTNSLPGILSRRTTTGIARKRLTAGDAFTLLLGPLLGGAYIADAQAKNKRRKAWDEKIAAVQAEVEQIRGNGVKTYSFRSRNLTKLPALSRTYSSIAATKPAVADEDQEDPIEAIEWPSTSALSQHDEEPAGTMTADLHQSEPIREPSESQTQSTLGPTTIETCKRVQRLVAIKLAIRMILHVHIGKSPRYINTSTDYAYDHDPGRLPHNADELIRHLKQVSNTLRVLTSEELRLAWAAYQNLTRGESSSLDKHICHLAGQFRRGETNVTQLIELFAEKLLSSSESPTVHGYIPLLTVLSRARFDELGAMVDGTIIEARLPYDRHALFTLLWQYGKNKEARSFEKLIKKLTTDSANSRFGEQWLWRNIHGTLIPTPPSQDPQLLQILIYAALKCNQPHRAEAWSTLLSWTRNGHLWRSHVMRNFLKYYSAHQNWHKGKIWMRNTLDQAEMLAGQGIRHVQRVTFAMLDFCVAYGDRASYRDIMKAASECRLGIYSADPDLTLTRRAADILQEWECHHDQVSNRETDDLSPVEKARRFSHQLQHIPEREHDDTYDNIPYKRGLNNKEQVPASRSHSNIGQRLQDLGRNRHDGLGQFSHVRAPSREISETSNWRNLCVQQQAQLDSLKRQLESLRSIQESNVASNRGEFNVLQPTPIRITVESLDRSNCNAAASSFEAEQAEEPERTVLERDYTPFSRPIALRTDFVTISDRLSSRPVSRLASSTTTPISEVEKVIRQEPRQSNEAGPVLRRISSERRSITIHKHAFIRPSLDPVLESKIQFKLPLGDPLPQKKEGDQLVSKPSGQEDLSALILPSPTASSHSHLPTVTELDRALTFCTHIIDSLTAHITQMTTSPIRPLYMLVSTLPRDLVITVIIDGTFAHFVRQMLTSWEHQFFWDKLTVEMREGQVGLVMSEARTVGEVRVAAEKVVEKTPGAKPEAAAHAEVKQPAPEAGEEEEEEEMEMERRAEAETPPSLPITREVQLPKQVIRPIESRSRLAMLKAPYRRLGLQLEVNCPRERPAVWVG